MKEKKPSRPRAADPFKGPGDAEHAGFYSLLLESLTDSIYLLDPAGRYLFINSFQAKHLGCPPEAIVGRPYGDFHTQGQTEELLAKIEEVLATGVPREDEFRDDQGRCFLRSLHPIREPNPSGPIRALAVVEKDISERCRIEDNLKESEIRYRTIIENIADGYYEVDLKGNITECNEAAYRNLDYSREEFINMNFASFVDQDQLETIYAEFNKVFMTGNPLKNLEFRVKKKGPGFINIAISCALIRDSRGRPLGFRGIFRDLTEFKESVHITKYKTTEEALRQSEERWRTIIENIEDGYYETDLTGRFTFFNDSLSRIMGYSQEEMLKVDFRQITDPENAREIRRAFNELYRSGVPVKSIEWIVTRKDGSERINEISASLIQNDRGEPLGFRGIARDVTERKNFEAAVKQMAYYDALTGLPNRRLFADRLNLAMANADRKQNLIGLLMLDLDNFKAINDAFGHAAGDKLLVDMGARLSGLLRKADTVARLGGDEFIILLSEIKGKKAATTVARKIIEAAQEPFRLHSQDVVITTSVGIALYPEHATDGETLIKFADDSMYLAKQTGKNRFELYRPARRNSSRLKG